MKLRGAIRSVMLANRFNQRRYADGTVRNDVKTGASKEAHAHGVTGGLSFISSRAQHLFETAYTKLGRWIERNHIAAMALGLLILLSGLPGTFFLKGKARFLWFNVDSDLSAFALTSTRAYRDYDVITRLHDGAFMPPRPSLVVLSSRDAEGSGGGNAVLSYPFMSKALDIINHVYGIQVNDSATGATYGFADLCQLTGDAPPRAAHHAHGHRRHRALAGLAGAPPPPADISLCASRGADVFSAVQWDQSELQARAGVGAGRAQGWADYAPALHAAAQVKNGLTYGAFNASGVYRVALQRVNATEDYRTWRPTTLQIPLQLEHFHDATMAAVASKWESEVAKYLTSASYHHRASVKVSTIVESTFEQAMQQGLDALTPWIFVVVAVMVLYSGTFLSTQVRTNPGSATQFSLITQGSAVSGLAGFSSFGWMCYLGFQSINMLCICAVFLVAAVGVDCTFIFVSAMKAAGPDVPLKDAMPMAMAEGATAISVTSLTSVTAFLVSAAASSAQPAFVKFNVVMAIALTLNFLGFILFFAGFQVQNEHRILNGKADLAPWKDRPPGKLPDWVDVGNKLRLLIVHRYAPNLVDHRGCGTPMACKVVGLLVMLATLAVSCAFVGSIGVGMPDEYLVLDSSYLYDLSKDFASLTDSTRPLGVSMLVEHLDLMAPHKLQKFLKDVVGPLLLRDDVLTVSCLPAAYAAYSASASAQSQAPLAWKAWLTDAASPPSRFANALFGGVYRGEETGQFSGQVVPRQILCSIAAVGHSGPSSLSRIDVMNWYLNFSNATNAMYADTCFPCDATRVTFFAKEWALKTSFDEELPALCWSTIALALLTVGVVLLLALPVHRALISVLNIFLVVFAIIGFMGYAGISYNLISYCTLTMAIGFCVDYTVELMHFSCIGEPDDSMGTKFANALKACGYDVLHGCATALIGVFLLGLSGAMYARLFSYLSLVMCFYGGAYALWCLPSSMTLLNMAFLGGGKTTSKATGRTHAADSSSDSLYEASGLSMYEASGLAT